MKKDPWAYPRNIDKAIIGIGAVGVGVVGYLGYKLLAAKSNAPRIPVNAAWRNPGLDLVAAMFPDMPPADVTRLVSHLYGQRIVIIPSGSVPVPYGGEAVFTKTDVSALKDLPTSADERARLDKIATSGSVDVYKIDRIS